MGFFNLFDFLGRKISTAEISTVCADALEEAAFRDLALSIAISYVANAISKCEFKVYDESGKENKTDYLYYLLNVNPNPTQSSSEFLGKVINHLYRDENGALVVKIGSYLYCADSFVVDTEAIGKKLYKGVTIDGFQTEKIFRSDKVYHFALSGDNKIKRLVSAANKQFSDALSASIKGYKRSKGSKYKFKISSMAAGDKDFEEKYENIVKNQLSSFINSDIAVYPQFEGTDLIEMSNGSGSSVPASDISTLRKEIFETTAAAFKIPISMMYGSMTNINEIVKVFLSFCIDPLADMISEELTRKTTDFSSWKRGKKIVVDTSTINHIDILEVAAGADKLISSGTLNIDEVRAVLGYDEIGTDFGKKHFVTKNYIDAEELNSAE